MLTLEAERDAVRATIARHLRAIACVARQRSSRVPVDYTSAHFAVKEFIHCVSGKEGAAQLFLLRQWSQARGRRFCFLLDGLLVLGAKSPSSEDMVAGAKRGSCDAKGHRRHLVHE